VGGRSSPLVFDEQGIAKGFRKRILNAAMQHLGVVAAFKHPLIRRAKRAS
jgi:hypothetical protein